jgi:hypothetical protein
MKAIGTPVTAIYRTPGSGGSFGASSLRLHVGIGPAARVEALDVRSPGSGTLQRVDGPIAADARYELREDRAGLVAVWTASAVADSRASP